MYQAKVKTVEQYSDSQSEHLVHKGKLVLIKTGYKNEIGKLACNRDGVYNIPRTEEDSLKSAKWFSNELIKPIIISETEEIEVGDWFLFGKNNLLVKAEEVQKSEDLVVFRNNEGERIIRYLTNCKKVLALPEHFSDAHLQAIVDGKMSDGDEVLIKCVPNGNHSDYELFIYLNQQNHITLFPVKQSLEEAYYKYYGSKVEHSTSTHDAYDMVAFAEWAKKNNY